MQQFKICYIPFPDVLSGNLYGSVVRKKGHIVVFIDSRLSDDQKNRTLKHELSHIVLNHFDIPYPGDGIEFEKGFYRSEAQEAEADKYAEQMTEMELSKLMEYAIDIRHAGEEDLQAALAQI